MLEQTQQNDVQPWTYLVCIENLSYGLLGIQSAADLRKENTLTLPIVTKHR